MVLSALDDRDATNPAEHHGACVPRLRGPHRPRRMGRGLPRPLRNRIAAHRARVLDHVPPSAFHDDVRGRLLDDRCRIRELSPDPPGRRSGEAIHRRVAVLGDRFSAAFFAFFSAVQLAAAFVIPYTKYRLEALWLAITVFLILAYIATRTMAIWPIGFVEEVEPLGIVSKLVELVTVLVLVSLLQSDRASRRQPVPVASPSDR